MMFDSEQVANAISSGLIQIKMLWVQMYAILSNTEVFDAELSMQLTEAMNEFSAIGSEMLKDLLRKDGWTNEEIEDSVSKMKRMLGYE